MDKKLVKQYGTEILSYRLRTARQKKRMQYEDFDKALLQLSKERRRLYKQKWNLGWEPLVPPVQKGWKRFFVLRDDVARSKHALFFENILNKINTYDWSYRKDFKIKKRRFGRKQYVVKRQSLLRPYEWQFIQMQFTDAEKQFFHEVWETDLRRQPVKRYEFNEPWRFVLRIRPNIIDKVKKRDAQLEKRIQEIDNYIEGNAYNGRIDKLLRGNTYKWWDREDVREKSVFKNKSLQQILDKVKEELL